MIWFVRAENTRTCENCTRNMRELHAKHVQFSHVRVFSESRDVQKSVTRIIYLGPLPTDRGRDGRGTVRGRGAGRAGWIHSSGTPRHRRRRRYQDLRHSDRGGRPAPSSRHDTKIPSWPEQSGNCQTKWEIHKSNE